MIKWYYVSFGIMGLMPDGKWQLFATSEEYVEALETLLDDDNV